MPKPRPCHPTHGVYEDKLFRSILRNMFIRKRCKTSEFNHSYQDTRLCHTIWKQTPEPLHNYIRVYAKEWNDAALREGKKANDICIESDMVII